MKTISDYTIYCTEEQTKKALELGVPLFRLYGTGCSDYIDMIIISETEAYTIPTAEQLIGWLEEQDIFINVNHISAGYGSWLKTISKNEYISENLGYTKSRKEATLAAIDAALDYLSKNKK